MELTLTVKAGRLAAVQDLGRSLARIGLSTNGALDQNAARAANALVGNDAQQPLIEMLLVGSTLTTSADALIAVTGADADVTIDGAAVPGWRPLVAPAGSEISIGGLRGGIAGYLAVAGRWQVPIFAGSAAADPGFGFATAVDAGVRIEICDAPDHLVNPWLGIPLLSLVPPGRPVAGEPIDIMPGADIDIVPGIREALTADAFTVSPQSNYVGVRLSGSLPKTRPSGEILSHGVPVGAVELPPSDELIILQRGRSLTAGYPIVAVVSRVSQDRVAQLRPGARCQLRWRTVDDCVADARRQQAALEQTTAAVRSALAVLSR